MVTQTSLSVSFPTLTSRDDVSLQLLGKVAQFLLGTGIHLYKNTQKHNQNISKSGHSNFVYLIAGSTIRAYTRYRLPPTCTTSYQSQIHPSILLWSFVKRVSEISVSVYQPVHTCSPPIIHLDPFWDVWGCLDQYPNMDVCLKSPPKPSPTLGDILASQPVVASEFPVGVRKFEAFPGKETEIRNTGHD